MNLKKFSETNARRCVEGFKHRPEDWSLAEWTNALAGEAGEACNIAKKLLRFRDGVAGNVKPGDQDQAGLRERLAREVADVIIYADLIMHALAKDTGEVVAQVFNAKSDELGVPFKVERSPLTWSREAPTTEGWWFYRSRHNTGDVIQVFWEDDEMVTIDSDGDHVALPSDLDSEWAGPVYEPVEPAPADRGGGK